MGVTLTVSCLGRLSGVPSIDSEWRLLDFTGDSVALLFGVAGSELPLFGVIWEALLFGELRTGDKATTCLVSTVFKQKT